jgi:carbon monoxide dehydrogenase subunit G
MKEVVSKTGKINKNADEVYPFLADFRNLSSIIPEDKIKDWNASEDECDFTIEGIGKAGMKIVEKEPNKLVKLTSSKETQFDFNIWIQLKQVEEKDTRVRITLRASLNPFMAAMVSGHLQKGVDTIVDKLADFFNNR